MARPGVIGDDPAGPVAESVDARAVHRSISWFKSRPGLQPSLLRSFGLASQPPPPSFPPPTAPFRVMARTAGLPRRSSKSEGGKNAG
jgi:hypothetical protein